LRTLRITGRNTLRERRRKKMAVIKRSIKIDENYRLVLGKRVIRTVRD